MYNVNIIFYYNLKYLYTQIKFQFKLIFNSVFSSKTFSEII